MATEAAFAPLVRLTRVILLGGAGLALVLGAVSLGLARRVVGPLKRLTAAARTLGVGGPGERLQVQAEGEVAQLAEAFNRMADALAGKEAQLRERAESLAQANKELEAFAYSVSHDLRAPLRAMDGFSRLLLRRFAPQLPPEAQRYVHPVRAGAQEMGGLVDDLLEFSRLGRESPRKEDVLPAAIARRALEELRAECEGRRLDIRIGALPACRADPRLLKQVFVNLLGNAIKFTRRREVGVIELGWAPEGGRPGERVYLVKDNGAGFEMAYAHKLFGVFQRLHRAEEYEGSGVGLAVVQRIIQRHGGRVWAEGETDKGATSYIALEGGTQP